MFKPIHEELRSSKGGIFGIQKQNFEFLKKIFIKEKHKDKNKKNYKNFNINILSNIFLDLNNSRFMNFK